MRVERAPLLRRLHGLSAVLLLIFLAFHLANHLAGIAGLETHGRLLAAGRAVYRHGWIEPLLLGLVAWQAASGLTMAIRGWRTRRGAIAWAQAISGIYIALFLLIHSSAVIIGRIDGLDTDLRFAAGGMHGAGAWFFVPYYFLAVIALAIHVGCAIHWRVPENGAVRRWIVAAAAGAGAIAAALIVAMLCGAFYPVPLPVRA